MLKGYSAISQRRHHVLARSRCSISRAMVQQRGAQVAKPPSEL